MVGGRSINGVTRNGEPHRRDDVNGKRLPVLRVKKAKNEHEDLNRSRSGGRGGPDAPNVIDAIFTGGTGIEVARIATRINEQ